MDKELRRWKAGEFSNGDGVGEIYEVRPNVFKVTGKAFWSGYEFPYTQEQYLKEFDEALKERSGVTNFKEAVEARIWEGYCVFESFLDCPEPILDSYACSLCERVEGCKRYEGRLRLAREALRAAGYDAPDSTLSQIEGVWKIVWKNGIAVSAELK